MMVMLMVKGNIGNIYIKRFGDASNRFGNVYMGSWKGVEASPYTKYNIKETDFRIKTATFTSPQYIDLTTGMYAVLIHSKYHENFGGIILDADYDETTGLYSYQCQDFSRLYMGKFELIRKAPLWRVIRFLVTRGAISTRQKATKKELKAHKGVLSGLKPLKLYDQSLYEGNKYNGNPFKKDIQLLIRDKTFIETIRDLVYGSLGWFDVWFNHHGVLQIDPLSKTDWENTGLHLTMADTKERKFKFSTTNAITTAIVDGSGTSGGQGFGGTAMGNGLDLTAFFGYQTASISNNSQQTGASKTKSNATGKGKTTATKDNPYGNKAKKIWIGADGGSGSFTREIVKHLEKAGWKCHYSGEGPAVHNNDYNNVTKDYQILAIVDNGFCCTTIKEAYEGYAAPILKRKNVTVMFMFDSRSWTNARGMKPFRYGDFKNHVFHTAHDDSSGYCKSMNATKFFKKHKAVYCASPTAKGMVDMFLKGGYFASKGIKV